jgi:hypothetical protein
MRGKLISLLAILVALVGWWGLYELTGNVRPDQSGAQPLFYALVFLAVTGTLVPPAAYLNHRLAPQAVERDPWRFFRQSAWAGMCVAVWTWLQAHRVLNLGTALVIALIFVAIEVLIARLRDESKV